MAARIATTKEGLPAVDRIENDNKWGGDAGLPYFMGRHLNDFDEPLQFLHVTDDEV